MPKISLQKSSSLGPAARKRLQGNAPGAHGVTLMECDNYAFCSVLARTDQVYERFKAAWDFSLPDGPAYAVGSSIGAVCVSPRQWLIICERCSDTQLEKDLVSTLGDTAAIFEQTAGRTLFRLTGPRSREVLAKGLLVDLHPQSFGSGNAASTSIAYLSVTLWQIDEAPTYNLAVFRSFAESLWNWITEASEEFGIEAKFAAQEIA